jgi:Co/Zn/Cd efflux system component
MLSDVSAFLVAIFAAWAATQRSTWHYSFGYHRIEILGALISVLIIWMLSGALVVEAVQRVINPVRVDGKRECGAGVQGRVEARGLQGCPAVRVSAKGCNCVSCCVS